MSERCSKTYVGVRAVFSAEGEVTPLSILWEDGRKFEIDRVTDCRRAASLRAGGAGLRYTVRIGGRPHYLFYEENNRWFVETKG